MQTLTQETLRQYLTNLKGATFATIESFTVPAVIAACPFRHELIKISRVNCTINFIYENAVNRQRMREDSTPDFHAVPRKWGTRITGTPLVEHKGEVYLEVKVEKSLDHEYRSTLTGNIIQNEIVQPFLRPAGASRQEVEKQIILRDYKLTNLRRITVKGEEYVLIAN